MSEDDPGFKASWEASAPRRLVDTGRYQQRGNGSYQLTDRFDSGAGVYRVRVGSHVYVCLRVIDLGDAEPDESSEVSVAFVEPSGRTILYR